MICIYYFTAKKKLLAYFLYLLFQIRLKIYISAFVKDFINHKHTISGLKEYVANKSCLCLLCKSYNRVSEKLYVPCNTNGQILRFNSKHACDVD